MEEEKPLTLVELGKILAPKIKELKEKIANWYITRRQRELEDLRKKLERLKVEREYEEEKAKLLSEIEELKKKSSEERLSEAVD